MPAASPLEGEASDLEEDFSGDEEEELPAQQISLPLIEANCLVHVTKDATEKE